MTDTQPLQLDYWTLFHTLFRTQSNSDITSNPPPRPWTEVHFERPLKHLLVFMNTRPANLQVGVQRVIEGADRERLFPQLSKIRLYPGCPSFAGLHSGKANGC